MVNAVILAGGESRRFGTDKAFAKVRGSTIIESLLFLLSPLFPKIIVVTNHPDKYKDFPVEVVTDKIKGRGPLVGIYSGLSASDTDRNFIVACDMPLLNPRLIQYIASIPSGKVVVPRINGRLEPLHAVYAKGCIPAIENQIAAGDLKIQNFFSRVDAHYVEEDEVKRFDPTLSSFLNINLQKDLKRIEACLRT
ncbi:MAG: molybdenum cofactor guanylyltransferase MobA [Candidatus Margulisbacteria bacterium]|nr:molybdenum cofactor guanylyltransferase MobA [Candidatus Margulisiibacteriota bacterium]MBU1022031.1 molybdenum cofactor guanylyltransferase MobA [Candidatus Margulisiibacteriota bacterium]MBU1729626.1 molybdenum cofactor guanylyltransferase MobA [Candidatus Margulisiibacteriota bacterium]MBU1954946.1 molybdenum cofactor guanylyltransferase MobA [Candidatus Margulisiibacteriota bacterium]